MQLICSKEYTNDNERMDFIVEYNHKLGCEIRYSSYTSEEENENEKTEIINVEHKVVEAWDYTEEELEQQKAQRTEMLYLTGADVERGIYKAKGMDFDDIIALVSSNPPSGLDIKALKIELKANNFYRGNPYVDTVGSLLGFTSKQLDDFFETNDYTKLLQEEV